MSDFGDPSHSHLIQSHGWGSGVQAQLLRSGDAWDAPQYRSHWHTLRRLFEDVKVDAVVCIEGRPTVCLMDARGLQDAQVEETRKKLWNLGATTLLVVERPNNVLVFSTLAKPSRNDREGRSAQLEDETIEDLKTAELALRVQQLVRRVETGAIYREHKPLFNPNHAVDQSLLKNLRAVRDLICSGKSVENYRHAHTLIGKFLFSCYLLDRGIIGPAYLRKNHLPEASDMLGLLERPLIAYGHTLNALFLALQRDFNGSLFGDEHDDADRDVIDTEVDYLRRFLTGEDLRSGQMALFKLYDFSFIPVELISSIYQEFLAAEAEAEAPVVRRNQPSRSGQRRQGAYYTPPRLAELTVDIATEDWDTLLNKRCFDPACGSGVFLVILFVRMAEEWRKRNPNASTELRYNELLRLLSENLRGVDVHLTACLVTCFSLYLAFLDQMEPKEIIELREALEQTRKKLLPRILWQQNKSRPSIDSIRELDFFEIRAKREFDLVIGNPPWVSRKDAPTAEAWLFDEKSNPAAKGLKNAEQSQTLFPNKELACAFMWKAGRHARDTGRVCQVLPSRVFLSNNTDRFQAAWLESHRLESVWLLADYSFVLFPGADCPCFIGRYHSRRDDEALGQFEFITPKVELIDPRQSLIPVQPEDQKVLDQSAIITAAKKTEAARAWKQHHWGTLRDERLIDRLMSYPKLSRLVAEPPADNSEPSAEHDGPRKWWKGQGFKPFIEESYARDPVRYGEPKHRFWDDTWHYLPARSSVLSLVLRESECEIIGNRYTKLHRLPSPLLFEAPLLLINQACTKFLFSDFDVLFQHDFQSICAPRDDEDELLFLTAVLSSPLTQYLLFHTTSNIGIERDVARLEELLQLPFPLPKHMADQERSQAIVSECASLLRNLKREVLKPEKLLHRETLVQETKGKLVAYVYDYFDISEWERYLIEDTVELFRPSSTPGSLESKKLYTAYPSQPAHRTAYADTLVSTFQGWTRTKDSIWTESCVASKSGLAMVTFGVGGQAMPYDESIAEEAVEELLKRIRESAARPPGTVFQCLRGFAFYEGTRVHLLKPLSRRYWTRTAALNDADAILAHMMMEDGWNA